LPYVNNQGIKIFYESEGQGPPLVLIHPLLFSGEIWRDGGYVSELKKNYRIILLDIRGHGRSDKPDDSNYYDFQTLAGDIVSVMNDLNIEKAHYWGYSMGAFIVFHGMARHYQSRIKSLILGGFSVLSDEVIRQSLQDFLTFSQKALDEGMVAYQIALQSMQTKEEAARQFEKYIEPLHPRPIFNICKNLVDTFSEKRYAEILPKISLPALVYAGEADTYVNALKDTASKMPNCRFISFPGLDHGSALKRSDIVLPQVKKFLKEAVQS